MTELAIPELSLVCLVGVSGSGKSTFAAQHFGPFEVLSSDYCRGLIADDENDQTVTKEAFELLHHIAGKRLDAGRLTVVDATSVQSESRRSLVALARAHDVLPVAIVFDVPETVLLERTAARTDRDLTPAVIRRQHTQLRRSMKFLAKEGFRKIHVLKTDADIAGATVVREKLLNDFKHEHGPVRRHRRHPRLPRGARDAARRARLAAVPGRCWPARRRHPPRWPQGCVPR